MLPPLAPAIVERNPRFRELYKELTTARLNPDATSRLLKQQRAQADVEKSLHTVGEQLAQIDVVIDALESFDLVEQGMSPELLESALIIAAHAKGKLSAEEVGILSDEFDSAMEHAPTLATAVSSHLQSTQLQLTSLLGSADPAADQANLAKNALALKTSISNQRIAILNSRANVAELAEQLHILHRECLEASIRILEQVLHGSVARGTKARAEHLAIVAKGLDLKIQILDQTDRVATDPALTTALRNYSDQLKFVERGLEARLNAAQSSLDGYRRGGQGMNEIANKYAQLVRECDDVRDAIERLENVGFDYHEE